MNETPRRGSLLVVFLTVLIDLLGFGIVLPLLPIYADRYSTDEGGWQLGLLMASFSIMQFLFAPVWGRISDRLGRRPVIIVGLAGSVVFYALFGMAIIWQSMTWLFISRIGAGMAGATISTAHAYIADSTSPQNRSRGMALVGMAFGIGFTFGPLLGYLAINTGTSELSAAPGFVASGLSCIALLLALFLLPESLHAESESPHSWITDLTLLGPKSLAPSIVPLLLAIFISVFSFANFETTLSLLIKGRTTPAVFDFSYEQVCLTFAYIGFVLALVQGGIVRRVSGQAPERWMAKLGATLEVVGFLMIVAALVTTKAWVLFVGLTIIVIGFAFLTPSLNALISRRSDPSQQGSVMGIGQSVSSLARIVGSGVGIPLLMSGVQRPFLLAAGLAAIALALITWAIGKGTDFTQD